MTIQLRPRHPEKAKKADSAIPRKPKWIRRKKIEGPEYYETRRLMRDHNLATVCEEAACPNIGECWSKRHATMMIMGEVCTRGCSFCNVATGRPDALDAFEPGRVAAAVKKLGLRHVVITSVDRDDLDGWRGRAYRPDHPRRTPPEPWHHGRGSDALTFLGKGDAARHRVRGCPGCVQPQSGNRAASVSDGSARCAVLCVAATCWTMPSAPIPEIFTKSGLMVGLGESLNDVRQVMDDLRAAQVDFLTVGQYLQPTPKHHPIDRFWSPEEFAQLEQIARSKGFLHVSATPLTRSSFHADEDFAALRQARHRALANGA